MKKILLCSILLILLNFFFISCSTRPTYTNLEDIVKNNIPTKEIVILNELEERNLVLCSNKSEYLLGIYNYSDGVYDEFKVHSKMNAHDPDIIMQAVYIKGVGNIVWGSLNSDEHVETFIVEYFNGEIEHIKAYNNTFISYMPESLQNVASHKLKTQVLNVSAVNQSAVIDQIKTYNIADPVMVMK